MSGKPSSLLPLGAVRTDDGAVVVPESRRADGSVRKPIRIRQGYVPQDEVPKYKPIGRRMREQQGVQQRQARGGDDSADAVADELQAMTLSSTATPERPAPRGASRATTQPQQEAKPRRQQSPPPAAAHAASASASASARATTPSKELKTELAAVNKSLREISKLEAFAAAFARGDGGARALTAAQTRRVERRQQLEARRREITTQLDADTSTTAHAPPPAASLKRTTLRVVEL